MKWIIGDQFIDVLNANNENSIDILSFELLFLCLSQYKDNEWEIIDEEKT